MKLLDGVKKLKNKSYLEAVAAGCAMVSAIDGPVKSEEIATIVSFVKIDETLKVFDLTIVIDIFNRYIENFEFDVRLGKEKAFQAIRRISSNIEKARLVVLVCCAVAKADGEINEAEKNVLKDICLAVGLNPGDFELSAKALPPQLPPKIIPPSEIDPSKPPVPVKKSDNIPEWMRNPPKPVKPKDKTDNIPDWMRNPPKPRLKKDKTNGIPDWMRK